MLEHYLDVRQAAALGSPYIIIVLFGKYARAKELERHRDLRYGDAECRKEQTVEISAEVFGR